MAVTGDPDRHLTFPIAHRGDRGAPPTVISASEVFWNVTGVWRTKGRYYHVQVACFLLFLEILHYLVTRYKNSKKDSLYYLKNFWLHE